MNKHIQQIVNQFMDDVLDDIDPMEDIQAQTILDFTARPRNRKQLEKIVSIRINHGETYLNDIDVSLITDFSYLFYAVSCNLDVSEWDVSNGIYFDGMFQDCTRFNCDLSKWKLDNAKQCYNMFKNCKSLTSAPQLTNINLSKPHSTPELSGIKLGCYESMFENCESLVNAPELPATSLTKSCYESMFAGCISLENAPVLHSKFLFESCYESMFKGCKKLNYVKALFTHYPFSHTPARYALDNWLEDTADKGTLVLNQRFVDKFDEKHQQKLIPEGWGIATDEMVTKLDERYK